MPLLSWLSAVRGGPVLDKDSRTSSDERPLQSEEISVEDMNFETLADKVGELRAKLDWAYELCDQANLQFDKYRTEAYELKKSLESERDASTKAHKLLTKERNLNAQLQAQNKNLHIGLRKGTVLASQLQARLNTEAASSRAMTKHARATEEKLIDTQLDLEYLKCTTRVDPPNHALVVNKDAPLPAQPFVVVLVDGDAYKVGLNACLQSAGVLTLNT